MARIRPYSEIKFLPDHTQIISLKNLLKKFSQPDPHGIDGTYEVLSIYYDTPDLEFFHDKIMGIENKTKVRLRFYRNEQNKHWQDGGIEIKCRSGQTVTKYRIATKPEFSDKPILSGDAVKRQIIEKINNPEIASIVAKRFLSPVIIVAYKRKAMNFTGIDGLRFTFDSSITFRPPCEFHLENQSKGISGISDFFTPGVFEIKSYFQPPESIMAQIEKLGLQQKSHSKFSTLLMQMLEKMNDQRISV